METFIPYNIEETKSKAGKTYWKVKTDKGNGSVFDLDVAKILKGKIGQLVSGFDLDRNGNFMNIRKSKDNGQVQAEKVIAQPTIAKPNNQFSDARASKDTSMYTSYAKDVFCALLLNKEDCNKAMAVTEAILIVSQIKKAFA